MVSNFFVFLTSFFEVLPLGLVFLGLCILPVFPIPSSGLILVAGICFSEKTSPLVACLLCFLAITLASSWSYFFYFWVGSIGIFDRLLKRTSLDKKIFKLGPWNLAFLVRFLPGAPFCFQTALLGVSRIPFVPFLVTSLLAQALSIPILVLGGKVMFDNFSNPWVVVSIFAAVIGLLKLVSLLGEFYAKKSQRGI